MEFRIKHVTGLFYRGIVIPFIAAIAAIIIYLCLGFNITDQPATIILLGIFAVCAAVTLIFIILHFTERLFGAKITVGSDHVDIRMLLRHKRFYFYEIEDAKYTHYECTSDNRDAKQRSKSLIFKYTASDENTHARSRLTFYLVSGSTFSLNDEATGYESKRRRWITDPGLDPDEDVKLYQAYKCYCYACRQYVNKNRENAAAFKETAGSRKM